MDLYKVKNEILDGYERDFFVELSKQCEERYLVLSQVRVEQFVTVNSKIWGGLKNDARRGIRAYAVDFVVCDLQTTRPLVVIELDGASHLKPERERRDKKLDSIYEKVGLQYYHVPIATDYVGRVRTILKHITI